MEKNALSKYESVTLPTPWAQYVRSSDIICTGSYDSTTTNRIDISVLDTNGASINGASGTATLNLATWTFRIPAGTLPLAPQPPFGTPLQDGDPLHFQASFKLGGVEGAFHAVAFYTTDGPRNAEDR
jgi:hypothetical protein